MTSFVEIGLPNSFNDLLELLDIAQTRPLSFIEAEKIAKWMKGTRGELKTYEFNNSIFEMDDAMRGRAHNKPCYYCSKPINSLAGDPGEWPIVMSHPDEPGVPKFHHMSCVQDHLDDWN